ncbi:uncharacterized protein LOC119725386 [Patiria miniata]|uniref:Ig-like domain-containing protein n=1 Tax=Patiria miniata TaxID=46514 RepID=A0A913ZNN0_PATMI|nr:uncharacterized protein LOC119725386 [Patiria miniata]
MGFHSKNDLFGLFETLIWAAVGCYVLMSFVCCLVHNGRVQAIVLTRGGDLPPDEYTEVSAGQALTLTCSVSSHPDDQRSVRWLIGSLDNVITTNSEIRTADSRVSVYVFIENNHHTFSLHIANVTISDSGRYICSARWTGSYPYRWGNVYVSVKNFPQESPICSSNASDISPANQIVWCDSMQGYPNVTIRWTVESTSEELNGTLEHYTDETGQERVKNVLDLSQLTQPYANLVCTVTGSAFPGLNKTCNIIIILPVEPITSSLPPATQSVTTVQTKTDAQLTTTDARGSPGINTSTLVPAVVIPILLITLLVSLICIKQKRRGPGSKNRDNNPGRNSATSTTRDERNVSVIVPYSVTIMDNRGGTERPCQPAGETGHLGGRNSREAPYEVRIGPAGSAVVEKEPNKSKVTNSQNPNVSYINTVFGNADDYLVPNSHGPPESDSHYEHVNVDADNKRVTDVTSNTPLDETPYEVQLEVSRRSADYMEIPEPKTNTGDGHHPNDGARCKNPADDGGYLIANCHRTPEDDFHKYEQVNTSVAGNGPLA